MADKTLPQKPPAKRKRRKLPPNVFERDGKWYVKIRFRDGSGKRPSKTRRCAKNATDAREVREALQLELKQHGVEAMRQSRHTFAELAGYYDDNYLIEARYVDGRKVAGRRATAGPKSQLRYLRRTIGDNTLLRSMDYEFVRGVRIAMLADQVVIRKWQRDEDGNRVKLPVSRTRSIVDVNRKMALWRHMMKVARRKKWIIEDPFADAPKTLITPADEKKRRRVMQPEEEDRLLAACNADRDYLRLLILGLTNTLMRSESEFFKLRVRDLDHLAGRINVQQMNTKTLRARESPLPRVFRDEAQSYVTRHHLKPTDRLFPFNSVKRSWRTLTRRAGVTDLRIKDLRRTAATRLVRAGYPIEEVSVLLGHTSITMTYEYIGVDRHTTTRANELLDAMHAAREAKEESDTVN